MGRGWKGLVEAMGGVLLQPYYTLHLVSLLSYFVLRCLALPSVSPLSRPTFLRWEAQAGLSLLLVLLIKFVRSNSLEGFIGDALLYSKCVLALLVAILDPRILPWYLFAFAGIFLLWHQPTYIGADKVLALTPLQLEGQLLDNRTAAWLVEFGAVWSPQCNQFRRIFADISMKYSSPNLHFGRVDVGRFPNIASKYGIEFGGLGRYRQFLQTIDLCTMGFVVAKLLPTIPSYGFTVVVYLVKFTVALRQLPTVVLFEGGVESTRLPRSTSDGVSFAPVLTKSMVIRHFELDLLLIRSLSQRAGLPRGESLGK